MFCAAQLREWSRYLDSVDALGASLLIVTAEDPGRTKQALKRRGLSALPVAAVEPSLWAILDLQNPERPELPRPATFIIGPDGTVAWVRPTAAYSARTSVANVLSVIESLRRGDPVPSSLEESETAPRQKIEIHAVRIGARKVQITLQVPAGMHVYGRRERFATPLQVRIDDQRVPAKIPGGEKVTLGRGIPPAYWLSGEVPLVVRTTQDEGELVLQACTERTCSPPERMTWAVNES